VALITTAGATNANSYASLLEAEAYMATLTFKAAWTGVDALKEAALQQATRLLDTLLYQGTKATYSQALQWPRYNATDRNGFYYLSDSIPTALKNATAEFAFRLMEADRAKDAGSIVPSRLKAGALELEHLQHRIIPASVMALLGDLVAGGSDTPLLVRS
jgi:hypothetical protein